MHVVTAPCLESLQLGGNFNTLVARRKQQTRVCCEHGAKATFMWTSSYIYLPVMRTTFYRAAFGHIILSNNTFPTA
jgi:hypothetical protein